MATTTNTTWMILADDGSWLGDYSSKSAAIEMAQHLTGVQVKRLTTTYISARDGSCDPDDFELTNDELVTIYSR